MKDLSTGEMGSLVSAYDWSQTPLGASETWSAELQAAVELLVTESDRAKTSTDNLNSSLYNSQQRYETLLKSMDRGFSIAEMIFDAEGKPVDYCFLEVNSLFEQMTGLTNVIGKTALEIIPDLERFWMMTYGKVVLTGESVQFEQEAKALNRWYEVNAFPIDAPREFRFGVIFTDITDRKQAKLTLQASEQRYRALIDVTTQIVWNADAEGTILNSNSGTFTGQSLEEYQGWGWIEAIHPDDRTRTSEVWLLAVANLTPYKIEHRLRRYDGEYRLMSALAIPLLNTDGSVSEWVGLHTDITEARQAEDELCQTQALAQSQLLEIEAIYQTAPIGLTVIDVDLRFQRINQRLAEINGMAIADHIGRTVREVIPNLADEVEPLLRRVLETGEPLLNLEISGETSAQPEIYRTWNENFYPLKNLIGQTIGINIVTQDITDRVQLERDRECILQQKQTALEESERVNRIKDEFLAMLSHELRSPLNPILGWTKMLQTRKLDETKTITALATIERCVRAQCQLIDDLLDMARVLRGKLTVNAAPVNLSGVIESAIDTVQTAAIAKSIQINPVVLDIVQVSGDEVRLQQIVWNLLTNAVKFTPSGGRIDILLEQIDNEAQITIIDTGKGISPDFLPYIFESFRQEDASVTRTHGGLGLGMAIVYQLVEAHGGKVTASSPGEGKGATFTVRLPLLNANSAENRSIPLKDQPLDLNGIRVLAIDDNPDNLELLAMMLTQAGAEVQSVASAAKFLIALESFRPDVVVSDIGMPEIDGFTLLRQVRSLSPEQGGQVPAIAVTAYAGEIDRQQAITAGFQKHIAKPLEPEQLVGAIVSLLSK